MFPTLFVVWAAFIPMYEIEKQRPGTLRAFSEIPKLEKYLAKIFV